MISRQEKEGIYHANPRAGRKKGALSGKRFIG